MIFIYIGRREIKEKKGERETEHCQKKKKTGNIEDKILLKNFEIFKKLYNYFIKNIKKNCNNY